MFKELHSRRMFISAAQGIGIYIIGVKIEACLYRFYRPK